MKQYIKIISLLFLPILLQAQEHLIVVSDQSKSMNDYMLLDNSHILAFIDYLKQTKNGGKLSLVFITDHKPAVLRLTILPENEARTKQTQLALIYAHNKKSKNQHVFLRKKEKFEHHTSTQIAKRYANTNLEEAFKAVNRLLHEPYETKTVLILSDGCHDISPTLNRCDCATTTINNTVQLLDVGWKNDACVNPLSNHFYDLESAIDYLTNPY